MGRLLRRRLPVSRGRKDPVHFRKSVALGGRALRVAGRSTGAARCLVSGESSPFRAGCRHG
eukprot:7772266-Pyramimonas_sp.AAC.1